MIVFINEVFNFSSYNLLINYIREVYQMFRMTLLQHQSRDQWESKEGPVKRELNTDKKEE